MNEVTSDDATAMERLGGRLPLLRAAGLSPEQTQLYERMRGSVVPWADKAGFRAALDDGRMIGPFNPFLFSPAMGSALLALDDAEQQHTSLDARTRQVVVLTVGAVWACDYERYAHAAVSAKAGLSASAIHDLSHGKMPDDLSPKEKLAQRLTRQLSETRAIEPGLYDEARRTFDDKALVDLVFLAGIYATVCGFLNGFAIPAPTAGA